MKIHRNLGREITDGQNSSLERLAGGEKVDFHYHDVEEWLQVTAGQISFFSAGGRKYQLGPNQILQIPRGEVHRVEVGPDGTEYKMWVPSAANREHFANQLSEEEANLIKDNLLLPKAEDAGDAAFLDRFLSERLMFGTATGAELDKSGFIQRGFQNRNRSSDSVRILYKASDSILISSIVTVKGDGSGAAQSFSNTRLFVREGATFKCRVWFNYAETAAL